MDNIGAPSSHEYLLAKFSFDTAENKPCKVCPLSVHRSIIITDPQVPVLDLDAAVCGAPLGCCSTATVLSVLTAELLTAGGWCLYASANFERLVLGCVNADFCNKIII